MDVNNGENIDPADQLSKKILKFLHICTYFLYLYSYVFYCSMCLIVCEYFPYYSSDTSSTQIFASKKL